MKIISIDDRLKGIASLVDKCNVIADIGTDHGYLPIYLINNNIAKYAYACDVAAGPLNSAKDNIAKYQLEDNRPHTLEEVGKEFNVTRERIRQIEAKALRKLRHPSRSKKLKEYLE